MSDLLLDIIKRSEIQFDSLRFHGCHFDKDITRQLKVLPLSTLSFLELSSESFGNEGLKKIMKLDMPVLTRLTLGNTNITSDGIRLLTRRPYN